MEVDQHVALDNPKGWSGAATIKTTKPHVTELYCFCDFRLRTASITASANSEKPNQVSGGTVSLPTGLKVASTVWSAGEAPRECDLDISPVAGRVRWFDITSVTEPRALLEALPQCDGLEMHMLVDLLDPDEIPENRRWKNGDVRLASSFAVRPPEAWKENGPKLLETPSVDAVYEPVELLTGGDWLITRWHDACHYRGADPIEHELTPIFRDEVREAVAKRWVRCDSANAGDLGVLVMNELALTYAATHRRFYADLEEWELRLYTSRDGGVEISEQDERRLHNLWGARARLRDWLSPLNIPGLRENADKAWLPGADHDLVIAVDRRVDNALEALADLGETLRSSFHLIHIKKIEAKRERDERLQRDIGFFATGLVVPTLVVGFYGANTWIPGEHRLWGFWGMIVVMVVATIGVMVLLRRLLRGEQGSAPLSR